MKNFITLLIAVIGMITISHSQCTTAPYGQYPVTTFNPAVTQAYELVTGAGYAGEYSVISVVSGNEYDFQTYRNTSARYGTVTQTNGTVIVHGSTTSSTSLNWTATFTGDVYFYTHTNSGCGTSTQSQTRRVKVTSPPPTNDDPAGAISLTVNDASGYVTYSNSSATSTSAESTPSCASYAGQDVWFKVIVPNNITILEFDTQTGDITDGGMTIYRGTPGSLTEIECDDDDALDGLMPYIYREDFTPGETIYIRFWEYGGGTVGTFKMFVSTPQALPVELTQFEAVGYPRWNVVKWTTASEQNSSHFVLESSYDGEMWKEIATRNAAGNSIEDVKYSWIDYNQNELTYYRLVQYDIDGKSETYGPISVMKSSIDKEIVKYVNLMGQEVNPLTTIGLVIEVYSDGSTRKLIR
jgi:hypothetical protein